MTRCAPGPCRCPFLYVPTGNSEICAPVTFPAKSKWVLMPPAPRSRYFHSFMMSAFGTKLVFQIVPNFVPFRWYSVPCPLKKSSSSPEKRSLNVNGVLKMKSSLRNIRITGGALVIETYLAGSVPLPLKCWYVAFSGITSRLPAAHSNVAFCDSSAHTLVAPRPDTTYITSSYMWCSGSDFPPGLISTRCASFGSIGFGMLITAPLPPFRSQSPNSTSLRSSNL